MVFAFVARPATLCMLIICAVEKLSFVGTDDGSSFFSAYGIDDDSSSSTVFDIQVRPKPKHVFKCVVGHKLVLSHSMLQR